MRAELEAKKLAKAAEAAAPPPKPVVKKAATAKKKDKGLEPEFDFGDTKKEKKKKAGGGGGGAKKKAGTTEAGKSSGAAASSTSSSAAGSADEPKDARTLQLEAEDEVRQRVRGLIEGSKRALEGEKGLTDTCQGRVGRVNEGCR